MTTKEQLSIDLDQAVKDGKPWVAFNDQAGKNYTRTPYTTLEKALNSG